MKKKTLNTLFVILFFTLNSSLFSQDIYYIDNYKEFNVSLPGDVYYEQSKDDEGNLTAEILSTDDYELWVSVYEGEMFEYFSDLNDYINEIVEDFEYKNYSIIFEKNYSEGVTGLFCKTYSEIDDSPLIFGIIQNSISKKQYEIDLIYFNLDSEKAKKIIESIYFE